MAMGYYVHDFFKNRRNLKYIQKLLIIFAIALTLASLGLVIGKYTGQWYSEYGMPLGTQEYWKDGLRICEVMFSSICVYWNLADGFLGPKDFPKFKRPVRPPKVNDLIAKKQ